MTQLKRRGEYQSVNIPSTNVVALAANPHRRSIYVVNTRATVACMAFGKSAQYFNDMFIPTNGLPIELHYDQLGSIITAELNIHSPNPTAVVVIATYEY